jgi:hypothetical protein
MGIILIAKKQEKLRFPCIAIDFARPDIFWMCKTSIIKISSRSLVYKNNKNNNYPSDDNEVVADE